MALRSRSRTKAKGKASSSLSAGGSERQYSEEAFDYPHDTPASRAGFSVSVRRSENYQSAALEVWVEVPCTPGTEIAAGEFCATKASQILKRNEDDLVALVRSLS